MLRARRLQPPAPTGISCADHQHMCGVADAARRSLIETRIRDGWALLPVDIRIDLLLTLAENARASGDATDARRLAADAVSMAVATTWVA